MNGAVSFLTKMCDKGPGDLDLPTPSLSLPLPNQNGGKGSYTLDPPLGAIRTAGDVMWSQVCYQLRGLI